MSTHGSYLSSNIAAVSPEAKSLLIESFIVSAAVYGAYARTLIMCTFPISSSTSAANIEVELNLMSFYRIILIDQKKLISVLTHCSGFL